MFQKFESDSRGSKRSIRVVVGGKDTSDGITFWGVEAVVNDNFEMQNRVREDCLLSNEFSVPLILIYRQPGDDIALVFLDRNITFTSNVKPICLPYGHLNHSRGLLIDLILCNFRNNSYFKISPEYPLTTAGWGANFVGDEVSEGSDLWQRKHSCFTNAEGEAIFKQCMHKESEYVHSLSKKLRNIKNGCFCTGSVLPA